MFNARVSLPLYFPKQDLSGVMPSPEELSEHSDCGESGKSILFSKEFDSFLQGSEIFSPSSVQEVSLSDMFGELFGEVGNDPCIFSN